VINKFYVLCVIFSGSPDLTLKTCLVYLCRSGGGSAASATDDPPQLLISTVPFEVVSLGLEQ